MNILLSYKYSNQLSHFYSLVAVSYTPFYGCWVLCPTYINLKVLKNSILEPINSFQHGVLFFVRTFYIAAPDNVIIGKIHNFIHGHFRIVVWWEKLSNFYKNKILYTSVFDKSKVISIFIKYKYRFCKSKQNIFNNLGHILSYITYPITTKFLSRFIESIFIKRIKNLLRE